MNLPDDDPLLMTVWNLGKGTQHMHLTEEPGFDSAELAALTTFWTDVASVDLNAENARKLLDLAKVVPGFPPARIEAAEQQLARLPVVEPAVSA
ncbi:MAG: hypothetical protein SGJ27_24675 [Candidatus Melainabacteria bacterium]|nr:hypothetical protein [Candidatus Melainabacteria bacterium]